VISTMQRVGSAIGIAVIGSVLFGVANLSSISGDAKKKAATEVAKKLAAYMNAHQFSSPQAAGAAKGLEAAHLGKVLGPLLGKQELASHFMTAAASAMGVSVIFAIVAFALVFMLPRRLQQWGSAPGGH
jgi:hypothetical protein